MDYISFCLSLLFALGSASSLGLATYYFVKNHHKQGYAFSLLMFLCVVLAYVPQLESIKGGFVDAKFNRTLNQANDIIARLSEMALINARVSYTTLAWGGRLGAPYAKDKQAILDDIDRQLSDLKVSAEDRRKVSRTFVNLVGVDLSSIYKQTINEVIQQKIRRAGEASIKAGGGADAQAAYQRAIEASQRWHREVSRNNLVEKFKMSEQLIIPTELLDERELAEARKFTGQIEDAFDESAKRGGYSNAAAAMVDRFNQDPSSMSALLARELFSATFETK